MSAEAALQDCLAAEHGAVYAYGALGGVLAGEAGEESLLTLARTSYGQHLAQQRRLIELIRAGGGEPVVAAAAYELPLRLRGRDDCVRLARQVERNASEVYAVAVAATVDAERRVVASTLRDCAVREVRWGAEPAAFPGVAEF